AVLVGLAAGLVAAGTARRRPGAVAAGALVAFLPAVMAVVGHGAGLRVPAVLVAQAAIAALVLRVASGTVGGPVRSAIAVGGVASWFLGGAWAVSVWAADVASLSSRSVTTSTERAPTVALLVGLAAVALVGARFGAWRRDSVALAGAGGVLALVTAFGVGAAGHGLPAWVAAVIVAAGAAALGAALLERFDGEADPAPWGAVRSAASVVGAALAVVPVVVVLAVVVGLIARAVDAPGVGADVALADWLAGADSAIDVPGWASIVQLAGVALIVAAAAVAGRRWWSSAAASVAVGVVVVLPFALGLGVGAAAVGVLALAVGAAALVGYDLRDGVLVATAAALGGLAVVLAMGSTPLAVGTIAVVTALVVGLAGLTLRQRVEAAPLWVGAAGSSVVVAAGLEAWIAESPGSTVAVVVAGAAALVGSAAALVEGIPVPGSAEPDAGPDGAASLSATAVDVVAGVGLLSAATLVQSLDGLSLVVLIAAVWAGVAATRPSRRPLAFVAAALGVVVVWLRLAGADVDVVEAYTVPLALWLLGVGIVLGRGRASWTSWARYGAGLVALVGPTALLAIADVDPARTVVAVVAGTGLALAGSVRRLQAPLAIGGATVAGLAVRHLAPVAAELPRYLVFAVAG
ncbi:MAG: hypothetical protein GXY13_09470, partial [Acidimicrobiales bacterium]|nr:hypothetical protein [Acidimicrobiales bacterium]